MKKIPAHSSAWAFRGPTLLLLGAFLILTRSKAPAHGALDASSPAPNSVEVTIRLVGKTLSGNPKVVPASDTFGALFEKTTGEASLKLKKAGKNTWRCQAVEGQEYVIGWIVKKGWFEKRSKMFGYCSEPFAAKDGLTVEFSPGMPATFEYDLRKPPKGVIATPAEVLLLREIVKNGEKTFLSWGGKAEIKKKGILKITGLAAGTYQISARAKDQEKYLTSRTPFLYEDRVIEVKEGSANRFAPVYPEIDSTVEEGDVTIRGTLYGPDRKPLANKTVKVIPIGKYGYDVELYYPATTTDSNGKFEFVGIRPNGMVYVSSEGASISLGKESLTENAIVSSDIVAGTKELSIETGKPLDEIVIEWADGKAGRISDFTGKIVVMDVWATWCAPCIRAFPEVNSMAEEFSGENDIVFVALSIDYDRAVWKKTVSESNWKALKHGWVDRTRNSFAVFGRPIPYTLIIDKNGIIRAAGNGIDIKQELEKIAETSDRKTGSA